MAIEYLMAASAGLNILGGASRRRAQRRAWERRRALIMQNLRAAKGRIEEQALTQVKGQSRELGFVQRDAAAEAGALASSAAARGVSGSVVAAQLEASRAQAREATAVRVQQLRELAIRARQLKAQATEQALAQIGEKPRAYTGLDALPTVLGAAIDYESSTGKLSAWFKTLG